MAARQHITPERHTFPENGRSALHREGPGSATIRRSVVYESKGFFNAGG